MAYIMSGDFWHISEVRINTKSVKKKNLWNISVGLKQVETITKTVGNCFLWTTRKCQPGSVKLSQAIPQTKKVIWWEESERHVTFTMPNKIHIHHWAAYKSALYLLFIGHFKALLIPLSLLWCFHVYVWGWYGGLESRFNPWTDGFSVWSLYVFPPAPPYMVSSRYSSCPPQSIGDSKLPIGFRVSWIHSLPLLYTVCAEQVRQLIEGPCMVLKIIMSYKDVFTHYQGATIANLCPEKLIRIWSHRPLPVCALA